MNSGAPKLDRITLEAMLSRLRPRLHSYCARMAGSVIDGEDIVQETLLKAFRALGGPIAVGKPENWLLRIAHNAAQEHLRQTMSENSQIGEFDLPTIEQADSRYVAQASLRTFMKLPVIQRSAVILVDVLGLSLQEASEATGATLAATKAALHRGREQLRLLVMEPDTAIRPKLEAGEEQRLRHYVDLFNARDFDAVLALVAEDVQLEIVNRARMRGKAEISTYFGNYDRVQDWSLSPGFVDRRPAILIRDPRKSDAGPGGFMLVEWLDDKVSRIRDFRHAPYCLVDADIRAADR